MHICLKKNDKIYDQTDDYILELGNKGYNKDTTIFLIKNLDDKGLTEFLAKKYNKDYEELIKNDLFKLSNFDRYLAYQKKNKKLTIDEIVYRVELNIDKERYEDATLVKNPNDVTVLTNKYLQIPEDYEPTDLVDVPDGYANNTYGQTRLRKEANDAFMKMVDAAKKDNVTFYAESGYRDFEYQQIIYRSYVNDYGQDYADKYAARPGFSEHELGLAIDLANIWTITTKGEEYAWIKKNGHKYGFIIRYKKEWEEVTGYAEESWHIRYVGVKTATEVVKNNMSYEEYYIKNIANKKTK